MLRPWSTAALDGLGRGWRGWCRLRDGSTISGRSSNPERILITTFKRLAAFSLLFLLLSGAGTWVVYRQVAGREIAFDPALLSPSLVTALGVLLLIYFAADGLRLHFTLRALGHDLPLGSIARLVFINIFFSNVTPMATGGGLAQILYLGRRGVRVGTATAATTIRTVLAMLFIFSAAPMFLLLPGGFRRASSEAPLGLPVAIVVGVYVGFFAVVLLRPRWLVAPVGGFVRALCALRLIGEERARRWRSGARRELLRFARSFGHYLRGSKVDVALSVLFTAIFLLSLFSFPALLLWGLEYEVPYLRVLGLLVVTTFVMYFAPTPGASGVAEGVFGYAFTGVVGGAHLVLVTLAWRFLTVYLGMLVGVGITFREMSAWEMEADGR